MKLDEIADSAVEEDGVPSLSLLFLQAPSASFSAMVLLDFF